jgi:hypothetical protein
MEIDVLDILKSWSIKLNPNKKQAKIAKDRLEICVGTDTTDKCEYVNEYISGKKWSCVCSVCGCAISAKVFSTTVNACPKNKWINVDKNNGLITDDKKDSTLF